MIVEAKHRRMNLHLHLYTQQKFSLIHFYFSRIFIDFKKVYDSVRTEVLYNILVEFGTPRKLVRLIKMCLNETYSKIRIGKHFFWCIAY
jgi:hypothetical protein